jgi:hypothetical protein
VKGLQGKEIEARETGRKKREAYRHGAAEIGLAICARSQFGSTVKPLHNNT